MKTWKKLIALLMVLCLTCGCFAYAESTGSTDITQESATQTAETTVVLDKGVEPTHYTVVIPSTVTLDADGNGSAVITLKSGFVLSDIISLKVNLSGGYTPGANDGVFDNYQYAKMILRNEKNSSQLTCNIRTSGVQYIASRPYTLISVTDQMDNSSNRNATLLFELASSMPAYGKYTGTLTFSVVTETA